jgi:hypothetical protein
VNIAKEFITLGEKREVLSENSCRDFPTWGSA